LIRLRIILISILRRGRGVALALALIGATLLAGCGSSSGEGGDRVHVVASFYPLAEAATEVGGPRVKVDNLTPAGAEPHDLELKASQVAAIEDADVVLVLGKGFQPAVEKAAAGRKGTIELLSRLPIDQSGRVHEEGGGGSGTSLDPHVWLDPVLMGDIVQQVSSALQRADATHAATYRADAARYQQALRDLDARYHAGLGHCARHEIVTGHQAFGRLAARYGLTQEGITGISPDAEPSPGRLASLVDLVRRDGVTTIFTETLVSPKIAQTLAREAGVRTEVLDPIEGLTKKELAAGAGYVSVMNDTLRKLRGALGCR